jgi:hypothetical protein
MQDDALLALFPTYPNYKIRRSYFSQVQGGGQEGAPKLVLVSKVLPQILFSVKKISVVKLPYQHHSHSQTRDYDMRLKHVMTSS